MKLQMTGVLASLAVAAVLVTANVTAQSQEPQPQEPQQKEVTVTGCLIQGSTPTVFVLDKAKSNPTSTEEPGQSYVVVNKVEDLDLTTLLNHQVRITGAADVRMTTPERQTERDLPRLTATEIVNVADTCPSPLF